MSHLTTRRQHQRLLERQLVNTINDPNKSAQTAKTQSTLQHEHTRKRLLEEYTQLAHSLSSDVQHLKSLHRYREVLIAEGDSLSQKRAQTSSQIYQGKTKYADSFDSSELKAELERIICHETLRAALFLNQSAG